jgi:integrase
MHYLNVPELAKLFRVMYERNKQHQLIGLIGFYTGARISQIVGAKGIKGEDIFESDGKIVIKIHAAKRGYERLHTLHIDSDPAFDMSPLIELAKTRRTTLLFGGVSRQYFDKCLRERYCPEAGVHSDFGHSHMFRHSIAMQIWTATNRLGAISHFLAHKSPATALCYLAENDGRMAQEAVDSLQLA